MIKRMQIKETMIMNESYVQSFLNTLWGTVISNIEMDLLSNTLIIEIEHHNGDKIESHSLRFIDVSSYYYVKEEIARRFNFYDREEEVEYLQLSSISYHSEGLNEIHVSLQNEEDWANQYYTKFNIVLEIWESVIFIEARKIEFNTQNFKLK